ncbi:MAG: NAD(P)-binding domain-containing protein [Methanospirillum sp.]|nr:NAD(P)-binding domain-containing protein [Methanospirillum sp.]
MEKTGFIGFGSMNSMLIRGFLRTRRLSPDKIVISTRTPSKAENLRKVYPDLRVDNDNERLARECTTIVLGVRPFDV